MGEFEHDFDVVVPFEPSQSGDTGVSRRVVNEPASITVVVRELYVKCRSDENEILRRTLTQPHQVGSRFIRAFWPDFHAFYSFTEPFLSEGDIAIFAKEMTELNSIIMVSAEDMDGGEYQTYWPIMNRSLSLFSMYSRMLAGKNLISMQ